MRAFFVGVATINRLPFLAGGNPEEVVVVVNVKSEVAIVVAAVRVDDVAAVRAADQCSGHNAVGQHLHRPLATAAVVKNAQYQMKHSTTASIQFVATIVAVRNCVVP